MRHGYYVEVEPVIMKFLESGIHNFYFCGGRGIGKTYGALDMCRKIGMGELRLNPTLEDEKFMYLRRTGVEAQSIAAPESCPFKAYNRDEGYMISSDFISKLGFGKFYDEMSEEKKCIGYCSSLSTFANLRGVDFSDVSFILYDECIPENRNKHPLKDEGFLLLDMLETINRNRILQDKPEVVLCMLSNPIDLASDLLSQLNITPILNMMIFKNHQKYTDRNRSLHIEKYVDHQVSRDKAKSALYKFSAGTGYNDRSLSGNFVSNDLSIIKKVDLKQYTAFLTLENICVYRHKSSEEFYISQIINHSKYTFKAYEKEKVRSVFYWLYKLLVIDRKVFYDNYNTKVVFEEMIRFKPL